jgi:hypothetical protein
VEQSAHGEPSPRIALAALVRDAALAVDGVVGLDDGAGGLFVTAGGGERVGGVRCLAAPEGGYDVSLRLVCRLEPLHALADRVRAAVTEAAGVAQLGLATLTIAVADVTDDGSA